MILPHLKGSFAVSITFHALVVGYIGFRAMQIGIALPAKGSIPKSTSISIVSFSVDEPSTPPAGPVVLPSQEKPVPAVASVIQPDTEKPVPAPEPLPDPEPDPPTVTVPPAQPSLAATQPDLAEPVGHSEAVGPPSQSLASPDLDTSDTGSLGITDGVDKVPAYFFNPKPAYPKKARKLNQQGLVLLNVLISSNGVPRHIDLGQSSGFDILDAAAADALESWRFVPAEANGQPIDFTAEIPVRFTLR